MKLERSNERQRGREESELESREEPVWEERDKENGGEGREFGCWSQYMGKGGRFLGSPPALWLPLPPLLLCLLQAPAQGRAGRRYPESPHLFTPLRASRKSTVQSEPAFSFHIAYFLLTNHMAVFKSVFAKHWALSDNGWERVRCQENQSHSILGFKRRVKALN